MLSHVQLFASPCTVACQASLSMRFSRQEYWSRSSFPPPRQAWKSQFKKITSWHIIVNLLIFKRKKKYPVGILAEKHTTYMRKKISYFVIRLLTALPYTRRKWNKILKKMWAKDFISRKIDLQVWRTGMNYPRTHNILPMSSSYGIFSRMNFRQPYNC